MKFSRIWPNCINPELLNVAQVSHYTLSIPAIITHILILSSLPPAPVNLQIVAQVMRMQHREKKQLTLVRRNSLLKATDDDVSQAQDHACRNLVQCDFIQVCMYIRTYVHYPFPSPVIICLL